MAYSEFVRSRVKQLPTRQERVHHATTGLVGEAIEAHQAVSLSHLKEELGDMEFYLAALKLEGPWNHLSPWIPRVGYPNNLPDLLLSLIVLTGDLLDMSKKGWIYNKPLEQMRFGEYIWSVEDLLVRIYDFLGTSQERIRAENEAKLRIRYPDGYSDAAAQSRADKKEGE